MTKRRRESKPERFVSKRQLSKWQRQKRTRNVTTIVGLAVIVAVVAILGVGYYSAEIRPYTRTAMQVNGATFDMRYYINMLKLVDNNGQSGASDATLTAYVEKQIEQMELIRGDAAARGVQVNRSDVEAELIKNNTTVTRERVDVVLASKVYQKMRDEYFTAQVPANQKQVNVQAMLLESEDAAQKVKADLDAGGDFDTIATDQSKESFTNGQKGELGWVTGKVADLQVLSSKFGDMALNAALGVLGGPVYDDSVKKSYGWWVIRIKSAVEPQDSAGARNVQAEGILLGSEQDARDVIAKLSSGSDFDTLAKELSQHPGAKDSGADLGAFDVQKDSGVFDAAVFDLAVGQISDPIPGSQVQTTGGYWVFRVIENEDNRALTADQQTLLVNDLVTMWVESLEKDPKNKVENLLTQEMRDFAMAKVHAQVLLNISR